MTDLAAFQSMVHHSDSGGRLATPIPLSHIQLGARLNAVSFRLLEQSCLLSNPESGLWTGKRVAGWGGWCGV